MITLNQDTVSKIGLGCVTFGREIDAEASFQIMDIAFEKGINFFDTAAAYGAGASETIVGRWLSARRPAADSIVVATKILPPYDQESVMQSVDESMKRLGVKTIDVLYLHRWDRSTDDETFIALDQLVNEGKLLMIGASNYSAEQLNDSLLRQSALNVSKFQVVQNNHNLAVSDLSEQFLKVCNDFNISVVTYSPLGAGFLTGKHLHTVLPGSRFDVIRGHQQQYFNDPALRRLNKLLEVAERTGNRPEHLALAWALHPTRISSVLVGARTARHLEQAFDASLFNDEKIFSELVSV